MPDPDPAATSVTLSAEHLAQLDRFRQEKGLTSRDAALALLLDIAFEAASGTGRRYWDRRIADGEGQ